MNNLYPLKFKPIFKEKIWGGNKISTILGKDFSPLSNCGESWEISGIAGEVSIVSDGFLKDNDLNELIEVYMGDLLGDKVYEKFGNEFPLLIKFIDANDFLSVQVHPDDELAMKRHNSFGKTEMWYVIQADKGSKLVSGFNCDLDKLNFQKRMNEEELNAVLNYEDAKAGDVFFIPSGRIHAIGPGILLAEIQQSSDITYRIHDWDRLDDKGNPRELHVDLAMDAIDFKSYPIYKSAFLEKMNQPVNLASCKYFTTNIINIDHSIHKEYFNIDSFVVYICLDGKIVLSSSAGDIHLKKGESVLIPAEVKSLDLLAEKKSKFLEVYIQ
jgi:mannose-6-phosphate isomerase